jgi:hypothetical protein
MNKFLVIMLIAASSAAMSQSDETKVLFIGNSYTGSNNLPQIFKDFSAAAGDTTYVEANNPGGTTFQSHTINQQTNNLINQGIWDYVVLQEQSQLPSFPIGQVETDCFPYAAELNDKIVETNPCGETVFFMTWGRENGDASNCANWPPVCTYQGMDSLLYERYMQMTLDNEAIVSPVGAVWHYIRDNFSNIQLYSGDGSHPSAEGSYAAAVTFYAIIHRQDPSDVAWDYNLNALTAMQIRYAVKTIVYDSLSKWYVGEYDTTTVADFTFAQSGFNATFNNTSANGASYYWEFGDGDTSTQMHPSHVYPGAGNFSVSLVSFFCDSADTAYQNLVFEVNPPDSTDTTTSIPKTQLESIFSVHPNPSAGWIIIELNHHSDFNYIVSNPLGQPVLSSENQKGQRTEIDMRHMPKGIYQITVVQDGKSHVRSVMIN